MTDIIKGNQSCQPIAHIYFGSSVIFLAHQSLQKCFAMINSCKILSNRILVTSIISEALALAAAEVIEMMMMLVVMMIRMLAEI